MDIKEVLASQNNSLRHPWELVRAEVIKRFMRNLLRNIENPIILDIGCGDTFLTEQLAKQYPNASFIAIDTAFSDAMLDTYKQKFANSNIQVFKTIGQVQKTIKQNINIVLLLDVIEHIKDDIKFLSDLNSKSYITENTQFIITVPAYQFLFSSHDVFLGHYRRYNRKHLTKNTQLSGLTKTKEGSFFTSLLLVRILQKITEKITFSKNTTTGLVEWAGGKTLNLILINILLLDFYITLFLKKLNINIPGLSKYIICRKFV